VLIGRWIGTRLLGRVPELALDREFRCVLTVLALRLVIRAIWDRPYGTAGDFVDIRTYPGHTLFVPGGVHETAVNTGTLPYRNLVVELL